MSEWSFACPDWETRLREHRSLMPDLPLDPEKASRAVEIFNKLRLPDVAGQPAMRDAAGEWFRDIVRAAFGSLDDTGTRMVSEIFAMVPKKQSKTTGGAAIMVTAALMNERPYADLLFIGPTQDVADLAFQQAAGMILSDPEGYLQKRFHIRDHVKTIEDRRTKAKLKVKTFDMRVMVGSNPVIVLIDELHVISTYSYASRVLGQVRGGLLPKPESLLLFITTQSDKPPQGAFDAELKYARAVRDGKVSGGNRLLPILYEFPKAIQIDRDKAWADPANWPMVLPNLGLSMSLEDLIADFETSKQKGDAELRRWASQHLNIQIGTATGTSWIGAEYWDACADPTLTLDSLLERSEVVTVGADAGGADDLFGLAVIGCERGTRDWLLWTHAWATEMVLERRKQIAEKLRDLEKCGDLTILPTKSGTAAQAAAIIERVHDTGLIPDKFGIGLDPVGVAALIDELSERGIETHDNGGPICGVPQGYRLSGAIQGLEWKLEDGTFRHGGQPLMDWCVDNARTERRGNADYLTKQAAGVAKIDPLIAAINAFSLMARNPSPALRQVQGTAIFA